MALTFAGKFTRRNLRLASGLVLFAYVATHLANHALGLASLETAEAGRKWFTGFWRSTPATAVFYAALAAHIALAFAALYGRRTLRMPALELLRLALGFGIPFLLAAHFTGTRIAYELFGQDDPYARITWAIWSGDRGLKQLALIAIAWAHGCLGIHFVNRHRPRYRRWFHLFFAAAVLVPVLGYLGFVAMAFEISARKDIPATALLPQQVGLLRDIANGIVASLGALLALTLAARGLRRLHERGRQVALTYPGRTVRVPRGWSVLEASRANGIPHVSLCGGRARCSTCRVRVGDAGAGALPVPAAAERRTLKRIGAAPDVRLACQLRPRADVAVTPLLRAGDSAAAPFGAERDVVILFSDLRRWTGLAENQLPYDLVYVLNEYFAAVGDAVRQAGGVPNQFIGDSVMAIFGMESGLAAGCREALAAARGIEACMRQLNARLQQELGHTLAFGIGIHAGRAAVGEVGYRDTRTLSAVGDAVNTASRLQELTKEYGVKLVISERVARAAGLDTASLPARELRIRGRSAPLRIYTIASPELAGTGA